MRNINKTDRPISTPQLKVVRIDGAKTKTLKRFYRKIAKKLNFPDYVSRNLDALTDALCDLTWLPEPAVQLYIKNPEAFLSKESEETKNVILEIFAEAATNQIEEGRSFMVRGAV